MQEEEEDKNNYIKMANIIVLGTMHLQAPVISTVLQAGRQAGSGHNLLRSASQKDSLLLDGRC